MIEKFHRLGLWRGAGPIEKLRRWRDGTPDSVAVIAHRADSGIHRVTYREYARHVERFAGALYELGVRSGQVVAVQLPNWWQVNAVILACARLGAVVAPIMTTIRARELERMLARLSARVCITTRTWAGFDHAAALAEMAPRLPDLRHRVVLGGAVTGQEVDFDRHFQQTPWEQRHPVTLDTDHPDLDRVFLVLFTSGTSGEPKAALHSINTIQAGKRAFAADCALGPQDRCFTPHALTHIFGMATCNLIPLLVGGTGVVMDVWESDAAVALAASTGVTYLAGAPIFLSGVAHAVQERGRGLPALRVVLSAGTAIPDELIAEVPRVLGSPLRVLWGMTEVAGGTWTTADDPPDWAAHSIGRLSPGLEMELRGKVSADNPGHLHVRGSAVCLATLGRDSGELTVVADHDDGWFDTGDLAVPDGRGGIRLVGRATDRIGASFMIPVQDVEKALRSHPAVEDVALVGYPVGTGGEQACAVVVARSGPPTLAELRAHLNALNMTEWYQPTRMEILPRLPRNANGMVQKELLRGWVCGDVESLE